MKLTTFLSAAMFSVLALAEEDSTTTCTSTTTLTKTVTMTKAAVTQSVYAEPPAAATPETAADAKPTPAPEAPAPSKPATVSTNGASSMFGDFSLAALAGAGAVVVVML